MRKILYLFMTATAIFATSCSNDDDVIPEDFNGDNKVYQLEARSNSSITGTATVVENSDGTATINLKLNGTTSGSHPAHIHANSAAEGGDIIVDLNPVDGATGESSTTVSTRKDGSNITFAQILELDAYINVHQSSSDLGTLIAQGDIGINELSGESKEYEIDGGDDSDIEGTATLRKRVSGAALLEINLEGTPEGGEHPAHIHVNSAAEGGDIAISLSSVNGDDGKSYTHIEASNDGTALTYEDLLEFDGYINVHLSAEELGVIVAQGDIGINELSGESKEYDLNSVASPSIKGSATFYKRVSGATLLEIELEGTPNAGEHPAHIHVNTAAESGDIAISLNSVNGTNGKSYTHIEASDDGTALTYEDLLEFDGYINVHLSAEELGVIVAQGDIGINALTGESKEYALNSVALPSINGTATFHQRVSGAALLEIALEGTPIEGVHPAHIHANTAAEGGDIAISLASVIGETGKSWTHIEASDDGTALTYEELLEYDGYINVHLSAEELGVIVAQGDIGANALTGNKKSYDLASVSNTAISGTATFYERVNKETLVTLELTGTTTGAVHPAHIHMGSVADAPGAIMVTLNSVVGETGVSHTNVTQLNGGDALDYEAMLAIDGYINVHLSTDDLGTIIAQGNVGVNVE
ncbi:CHRD domain-containing protein [Arenibacter lacus]|uniref:CHRD domain-containing protein n=1 Tax=Arenibacter lacus TaxID=2608629 RepID=UPI00123CD295|nr:CHRD domain-containing protein [Arenibacter lacus]